MGRSGDFLHWRYLLKYLNSILTIVFMSICLGPLPILAGHNDFISENITEILADPAQVEEATRTLDLSKSSLYTTGCPASALFGQQYQAPTDTNWIAATSDNGAAGSILVYDNFVNTGSINRISFWGINGYYSDDRWYVCYESPMEFQIKFYTDNNGTPGALIASYTISCVGNQTGLIYRGAFELYQYFADLPEPVEIEEGWMAIQGIDGNPECWFEWMSSSDGYDASSLQWDGISLNIARTDRAFCLQHQDFICGDIDGDNAVNLYDIIYYLQYKYKGGPAPISLLTADINKDGFHSILDIIFLLNYRFKNGPTPDCP